MIKCQNGISSWDENGLFIIVLQCMHRLSFLIKLVFLKIPTSCTTDASSSSLPLTWCITHKVAAVATHYHLCFRSSGRQSATVHFRHFEAVLVGLLPHSYNVLIVPCASY